MQTPTQSASPPRQDLADLRTFLQCRCGTLTEAFARLDTHNVGQITSDDFVKGLEKLGYQDSEDIVGLFQTLDGSRGGLININDFFKSLGGRTAEQKEASDDILGFNSRCSSARSLGSPGGENGNVWSSARRLSSDSELHKRTRQRPQPDRPPVVPSSPTSVGGKAMLASLGSLDQSMLASTQDLDPAASGFAIRARVARLEEQLEDDRRMQNEAEKRLINVVGASIAEQLDALRQMFVEERTQRQVDITGVRATVETVRATGMRIASESEESLRKEVQELRVRLAEVDERKSGEGAQYPVLLGAERQGVPDSDEKGEKAGAAPGWEQEAEALRSKTRGLEERLAEMSAEVAKESAESQKRCMQLRDNLKGHSTPRDVTRQIEERLGTQDEACAKLRAEMQERIGELRHNVETALEQERVRAFESLGRVVGLELDRRGSAASGADAASSERLGRLEAGAKDTADKIAEIRRDIDFIHERVEDEVENAFRKLSESEPKPKQAAAPVLSEERLTNLMRKVEGLLTSSCEAQDLYTSLRIDVDVLATQVGGLLAGGDGVRECLAALRGDVENLGAKLQEDVSANAQSVNQRLQSVEADLQRSRSSVADARESEAFAGGALGAKGDAGLQVMMSRLMNDRMNDMDLGLARVAEEVKAHSQSIETLQQRHKGLSDVVEGKLQSLLGKVDTTVAQAAADVQLFTELAAWPPAPVLHAPSAPSPAHVLTHSVSSTGVQEDCVMRRSSAPPSMLQSGRSFEAITMPRDDIENSTISALREENLRLREDNLSIREAVVAEQEMVRSTSPRRQISPRRRSTPAAPQAGQLLASPVTVARPVMTPSQSPRVPAAPQQASLQHSSSAAAFAAPPTPQAQAMPRQQPQAQPPCPPSPIVRSRTSPAPGMSPQGIVARPLGQPARSGGPPTASQPALAGHGLYRGGAHTASGTRLPGTPGATAMNNMHALAHMRPGSGASPPQGYR